jgi:pilin isopeptide linkage protein
MAAKDGAPMPEGSAGGVKTVELTGPGEREFGVMTFTDPGVYVYEISEIDMGDPGYTYDPGVYTLTFTVAAEGSALTVKSRTLTKSGNAAEAAAFANAYKAPDSPGGETTVVSGAKSWNHGDNPLENRPASITVLIRDGERIAARAVVTGAEHWQWSFKLPKYRADGSEIRYTADEEPVPGYTKAADGYNLMNSHESARPGEVTLSGRKTWDYKNAPADDRPESVTVYIKNGEETVRELTVTETAGWRWSVQLPLNGEDGRPVSYTVEEANVPHYTHRVERYDILNTYKSKNYPGDNPPATGEEDGGDLGPWLALFVCSAATMCVLLLMKRRERRGGKYYR